MQIPGHWGRRMSPSSEPYTYQSYLLRCWQISPATDERPARWRFVLRSVTEEPREQDFATLDDLFAFLSAQTETDQPA